MSDLKLAAFLFVVLFLELAGRLCGFIADAGICVVLYWIISKRAAKLKTDGV